MLRRNFLGSSIGAGLAFGQKRSLPVRFGVDLFSVRSQGFTAFQHLDHCAKLGAKVVHFSEIRFMGSLEPEHLKRVRAHAERVGIQIEIGMRSICRTSKAFDPAQGTAEQQLTRMVEAAQLVGSPIVRAFLGTMADRVGPVPMEAHIENTAKAAKAVRSRFSDAGLKLAIENHAGDMQARELKILIEEAGKDFVGACIDSGNPVWALEDPHLTLETLAPYIITSHVRDSAVWKTPDGIAVRWTRMGEGNVGISEWVRRYAELCPGKAMSLEIIVTGVRNYAIYDQKFWDAYRRTPAWEFSRFLTIADRGQPSPYTPPSKDQAQQREREDLEASAHWVREHFSI
ncbi:MAG: sugar phosphate isomerase/epimerase [Acidobacteria bacterium]|nr:sugar phosphate isomerase/epimerase [Acidobacteriota bacterium]